MGMNPRAFMAQRPMVVLALLYALGILAAVNWPSFHMMLALIGLLIGSAALALLWKSSRLRLVCLGLCAVFLGLLLGGLAAHPSLVREGKYQITGRVTGQSEWSEDKRRVKTVLGSLELTDEQGEKFSASKAYWTWYPKQGEQLPFDGQQVSFTGQVYHPAMQMNPQGFDFKAYLLQRGISLGISGASDLLLLPEALQEHASFWLKLRDSLAARLDSVFKDQSGLAKALLLGVREGLDEQVRRDFSIAGIAHVLAVSGLHVSFFVFGLLGLLKPLRLSPKARLLIAFVFLLLYCRMLDFTPSVVRASILSLLLLLGKVTKKRIDPLTSLATAFLLILLVRPLDIMNLGFQLSFLAVLGIVLSGDAIQYALGRQKWFAKLHRRLQNLILAYGITVAASLFTLVPLVNAFHQFSLMGLIISPLAIVLIGLLMLMFAIGLFLSFVSVPLAVLVAAPFLCLSRLYQGAVSLSASLPFASLRLPSLPLVWTAAFFLLLVILTRYLVLKPKFKRITAVLLAAGLVLVPLLPKEKSLRYIQLSTGFSDSAMLFDGETTYVIDTGDHGGDLVNLLLHEGRNIDTLFLTHLHTDHTGGLEQLLDSGIKIRQIVLPQGALDAGDMDASLELINRAKEIGIPVAFAHRGQQWQTERMKMIVLWPYKDALYPGMAANRGSLVLYWELDGISLLTTGDLQYDYAAYAYQPAQVVKLPHHGSRADNSQQILRLMSPQLALVTAMANRPERFSAALEHLDDMDAASLVTGQTGAITLRINKGQLSIQQHLPRRD